MKDILTAPFVEEMKKTTANMYPSVGMKETAETSAICLMKKRSANTLLLIM